MHSQKSDGFALRKPNDFPYCNGGSKTASAMRLNHVNMHRQSERFGLRVLNYFGFRNGGSEKAPASDPTRMTFDPHKDSKCLDSFKKSIRLETYYTSATTTHKRTIIITKLNSATRCNIQTQTNSGNRLHINH